VYWRSSTTALGSAGTFSKSLFPGIRLGFVVAPSWAQRALVAAKHCADVHCSVADQDTLAAFIAEGHMARHVRRMRPIYAARLQLLLMRLHKDFSHWLEPIPSVTGLHIAAFAKPSVDIDAIVERARARDVGVYSRRPYYLEGTPRQGIVFGYGSIGEREIAEGLSRLRRVMASVA